MTEKIKGKIIELTSGKVFFIRHKQQLENGKLPATYVNGGQVVGYLPGTPVLLSAENLKGAKIIGFVD